ncbi:hypothetical protein ZIOFF_010834 [Zingiber officinale]|uniref:Uncharacterized protein n=1 Tax=Zingiber officinale TaxID=94328 RepID=A0A8J5LPL9_ZINOF|nr:hypothetical protein ZIOFF_010834 [Zingiber officinale]
MLVGNGPFDVLKEDNDNSSKGEDDKSLGWVEWRETPRPDGLGKIKTEDIPNGDIERDTDKYAMNGVIVNATKCGTSSRDEDRPWGYCRTNKTPVKKVYRILSKAFHMEVYWDLKSSILIQVLNNHK